MTATTMMTTTTTQSSSGNGHARNSFQTQRKNSGIRMGPSSGKSSSSSSSSTCLKNRSSQSNGCSYVFGYGSLLCSQSRSLTCPEWSNRPTIPVVISGLERTWSKPVKSGMTAMGIRFHSSASCSGILIPLYSDEEWARLDRRERGYRRVEVESHRVGPLPFMLQQQQQRTLPSSENVSETTQSSQPPQHLQGKDYEMFFRKHLHAPGTKIWVYVPEKARPPSKDHPIAQTYVDTILRGCLAMGGEDLCQEFLENTTGWHPEPIASSPTNRTVTGQSPLSPHKKKVPHKTGQASPSSPHQVSDDEGSTSGLDTKAETDDEEEEDEEEEASAQVVGVWINDRSNPVYRRGDASYSRKNAKKIDRLIRRYRPDYFSLRVDRTSSTSTTTTHPSTTTSRKTTPTTTHAILNSPLTATVGAAAASSSFEKTPATPSTTVKPSQNQPSKQ